VYVNYLCYVLKFLIIYYDDPCCKSVGMMLDGAQSQHSYVGVIRKKMMKWLVKV